MTYHLTFWGLFGVNLELICELIPSFCGSLGLFWVKQKPVFPAMCSLTFWLYYLFYLGI